MASVPSYGAKTVRPQRRSLSSGAQDLALISSVPGLFVATYFIFNFGITKKAFLTLVAMSHLVLFMPLVMLLQGLLLPRRL